MKLVLRKLEKNYKSEQWFWGHIFVTQMNPNYKKFKNSEQWIFGIILYHLWRKNKNKNGESNLC